MCLPVPAWWTRALLCLRWPQAAGSLAPGILVLTDQRCEVTHQVRTNICFVIYNFMLDTLRYFMIRFIHYILGRVGALSGSASVWTSSVVPNLFYWGPKKKSVVLSHTNSKKLIKMLVPRWGTPWINQRGKNQTHTLIPKGNLERPINLEPNLYFSVYSTSEQKDITSLFVDTRALRDLHNDAQSTSIFSMQLFATRCFIFQGQFV